MREATSGNEWGGGVIGVEVAVPCVAVEERARVVRAHLLGGAVKPVVLVVVTVGGSVKPIVLLAVGNLDLLGVAMRHHLGAFKLIGRVGERCGCRDWRKA